jgi:hypothetical protein
MRTLVISDLHLGSKGMRDVLRQPEALERLLTALRRSDRLVLLGDVVELLEGRPASALSEAMPVLREIGQAMAGGEILVIPGNHDHALVRAWLRERRAAERPLGSATQVPRTATDELAELTAQLMPPGGRVRVQYPGAWLGPHTFAHHGHYLDQHLSSAAVARITRAASERALGPADRYELRRSPSFSAASLVIRDLPGGFEEGIERFGGMARAWGKAVLGRDSAGTPQSKARNERIAAVGSVWMDRRLERSGLQAMAQVAQDLGALPRARHVIFGHVHRLGPLNADEGLGRWRPDPDGPYLWNSGSWVHEPMLVTSEDHLSPFWPGGALLIEDDRTPQVLQLLGDVPLADLLPKNPPPADPSPGQP